MRIHFIAGARPNFMKIAPIIHEIQKRKLMGIEIDFRIIHTGQHYDSKMSDTFFLELNIPFPDSNLNCGGGSQAEQTGAIMIAYEKELLEFPADLVVVVGDVTSTMACSIVAKKLNTKVAHVEAGIRSFDLTMPEEINRMVTDSLSDYFFTTTTIAGENLMKLGVEKDRIFFVGNVMIDSLLANMARLRKPQFWIDNDIKEKNYFLLTLHRPANVDNETKFEAIINAIANSAGNYPVIFPVHPRTRKIIDKIKDNLNLSSFYLLEPMGYLEFNYLVKNSLGIITDSGGITEETTIMGIPCITLRDNTERPETVSIGTNELIGTNPEKIKPYMELICQGNWKKGGIPPKWDGKASERIVDELIELKN
ncbi:MAG: UDP-N-acetylglucosamine 2-epimerase (non-hydrolyzing) [Bacteroidota bacterium]|nr:UDP-N-acetylglucosamine 2-epimerase (non-hydrolyzing) [Bacteroidota bacterium]